MRLTSTLVLIGLYGQAVLAGPCRISSTSTSVSTTETSSQSETPTETTSETTGTTSHLTTGESSTPSVSLSTTPGSQGSTTTSGNSGSTTTPSSEASTTTSGNESSTTTPGNESSTTTPGGQGTTTTPGGQGTTTTPGGQGTTTTPGGQGTTTTPGGQGTTTTPGGQGTTTTPGGNESSTTTPGDQGTTTTPGSQGTTTTPGGNESSTTTPGGNESTTTTPGNESTTTTPGNESTTTTPGNESTTTTPGNESSTTTPGGQSTTSTGQSTTPGTTTAPSSTTTNFCVANSAVIDSLRATPEATPFCDNYLSITTAKSTRTITVTPTPINSLESITVTVNPVTTFQTLPPRESLDLETQTETVFQTDYATTTLPSVAILTCLNSAYCANPTQVQKRVIDANPPYIPADWDPSQISMACSCLALDSPTTTVTQYNTLTPSVAVVTSTQFYTPIVVVTETPVVTVTSIITDPVTIVSTSEATSYAVETEISTPGLSYRQYSHSFSGDSSNSGFTSSFFKSLSPSYSGTLASPYFASPNWPNGGDNLYLSDGRSFDSSFSALLFYGFFVAQETGVYTFSVDQNHIDNWGYLWVGNAAYSWNDNNAAFKASRTGAGYYGGSYSHIINEGDAIPIVWLWANGGGPGQSDFTIHTPGGAIIQGGSGNFVPACSDQVFFGNGN